MLTCTFILSILTAFPPTETTAPKPISAAITPALDLFEAGPFQTHYEPDQDQVLLVFDRVGCDQIDFSCVQHYEAESTSGETWQLEHNYLALDAAFFDHDAPFTLDLYAVDHRQERFHLGRQTFGAQDLEAAFADHQTAKRAIPPAKTPTMGQYSLLTGNTNQTSGPWSYWEHRSGYHRAGGGIDGADDTYAVDINLNVRNAGRDMDNGMPFFAAGSGQVVKFHGTVNPSRSNGYAILIEHGSGADRWWAGYLHASSLNVRVGDRVTEATRLGMIGNTGNTNNTHLHYVTYRGENRKSGGRSGLVSFRPSHSRQLMGINLSRTTLRLGESKTLVVPAVGKRGRASYAFGNLNDPKYDLNTWWTSSNRNVVTIDGRGVLSARGRGSAVITLYFSGERRTTTVTVE